MHVEEENSSTANNNGGQVTDGDNNDGENDEEAAAKRRSLVRDRLEFRTIPASTTAETAATTKIEPYVSTEQRESDVPSTPEQEEADLRRAIEASLFESRKQLGGKSQSGVSDIETGKEPMSIRDMEDDGDDDRPVSSTGRTEEEGDQGQSWNSTTTNSVRYLLSSIAFFNRTDEIDQSQQSIRNQECCSICLEPFRPGDTLARLKTTTNPDGTAEGCCNHWFHEDCILEWLQNHDDCPLCRANMVDT